MQQSTQRRSKRICTSKAIGADQEVEECAATDCCDDPLSEEIKVECDGPGCNLKVCLSMRLMNFVHKLTEDKYHLSCVGLGVMPAEEWFCDVYCRQNAGQPVRKRRRIGITA